MNEMIMYDEPKVVSLEAKRVALKTAGKGPTEPPSVDGSVWLRGLMPDDEFLTSDQTQPYPWLLRHWSVIGFREGMYCICPATNPNDINSWIWVDPVEFCKTFKLKALMEYSKDNE